MPKRYKIIIEDENDDLAYEDIKILRSDMQDNICELGLAIESVEEIKEPVKEEDKK